MSQYKILSVKDLNLGHLLGGDITKESVFQIIEAVENEGYEFVQLIQIGLDSQVLIRIKNKNKKNA